MKSALMAAAAALTGMPVAVLPSAWSEARARLTPDFLGELASGGLTVPLGTVITEPVSLTRPAPAAETSEPAAALEKGVERQVRRRPGSVVVIPVRGTISNRVSLFDYLFGATVTPPSWVANRVRQAVNDPEIKSVILDFDSPGGSVIGVDEAAAAIFAARGSKPIIAQVSGQCCSAAYWLAASCDEIVSTPSAMIGSIGVFTTHVEASAYYAEAGIKHTLIASNPEKVEANPYEPLSAEAESHEREMVSDYYNMFVATVAKGRGVAASVVKGDAFGKGRTYVASRAKERGLIDKIRTFDDTLEAFGITSPEPAPANTSRRSRATLEKSLRLSALK